MTLLRSFGFIGMTSILVWVAALVVLAAGWRHKRRSVLLVVGLVVSLVGLGLATLNSHYVSLIEPDRSAYVQRGLELQTQLGDAADKAKAEKEAKAAAKEKGAEPVVEAKAPPPERKGEPAYAYKQAGKQSRDEGKKQDVDTFKAVVEPAAEEREAEGPKMSEIEVIRANRYDRINLFFARLVPWLAAGLIALDLLLRFNPVMGKVASAFARRIPRIEVPSADVREYLAHHVRRGESFIYFGECDPVPEGVLHRLHLWKWRLCKLPRLLYSADAGRVEEWKDGRMGSAPDGQGGSSTHPSIQSSNVAVSDSQFVFDGVWFARYAFVVDGREASERVFAALLDYLRQRRVPRAAAFRTVEVVWDFSEPLDPSTLEEMEFLAADTNFRLVVRPAET